MELKCVYCFYDKHTREEVQNAVTIADGNATCEDHLGSGDLTRFKMRQREN